MLKRTSAILGSGIGHLPKLPALSGLSYSRIIVIVFIWMSLHSYDLFPWKLLHLINWLALQQGFLQEFQVFFNIYILLIKYFTSKYDVCSVFFVLSQITSVLNWQCWKWCDSLATVVAGNKQRTHWDHGREKNRAFASRQRKEFWKKKSLKMKLRDKKTVSQNNHQAREICKRHFLAARGISFVIFSFICREDWLNKRFSCFEAC